MKLYEAVQKAISLGYNYIAIDDNGDIFGYEFRPSPLLSHKVWGFWGGSNSYNHLGKYDYGIIDFNKLILNINHLTLRGVL